jgi:hypothetical protein
MKRLSIFATIYLIFLCVLSIANAENSEYKWIEGYLSKDYNFDAADVNKAEKILTKKWLAMQFEVIENGIIMVYGVGDKEGIFIVGKGGTVKIKTVRKKGGPANIGIKVGDGDMKASKDLHEKFQKILTEK